MKLKPMPPCRLQVLLARSAPLGIIFRRGPTQWVQLIRWDTRKDTFEEGQWFHGHIYVGRSDLSPSGSLLIYFANKFSKKSVSDREYTHAWTAISRPPFLTALALWPKGDCYFGGGLFKTAHDVLLNHPPETAVPHPKHLPKGVRVTLNPSVAGGEPTAVSPMERDGWQCLQGMEYDWMEQRSRRPAVLEKVGQHGRLKLRVGIYHDPEEQWLCSIVNKKASEFLIGIGTWADFDQQGRLVFASEGKLFSGTLQKGKVGLAQLADFNGSKPSAVKAPAWATHW
jgi:hypothetical protein